MHYNSALAAIPRKVPGASESPSPAPRSAESLKATRPCSQHPRNVLPTGQMNRANDPPMTRRRFLTATGTVVSGLVATALPPLALAAQTGPRRASPAARLGHRWFENAWRRAVIDMHIPDWDAKFLSEFNPDEYVAALVRSRAQSVVCYAHSHVGLFNYPTRVGRQHAGLNGRDIVAEMIERCHVAVGIELGQELRVPIRDVHVNDRASPSVLKPARAVARAR